MKFVACLSENGRLLAFELDELKRLPTGGKGVILMDLEKNERLASAVPYGTTGVQMSGAGRAGKATAVDLDVKILKSFQTHRARKGHVLEPKLKDARLISVIPS
jgi:topoisomerase-4 subunit A